MERLYETAKHFLTETDTENEMTTHEELSMDLDRLQEIVLRVKKDRDALLVMAKRIYAELDNLYDVDQRPDGSMRESPFSGAGDLMRSLKRVIEEAEQ